jgi:hypothetical protein
MYMKSYNETMYSTPIQVKMYGVCFIIIIILRGTKVMILTTFTFERKRTKSKQHKHSKWGTI